MTINIISEKEEGNFETDDNPTNAINGKGSNVNVHFNPESNPDIPTLNRKTGRVSNKKRPSQVGLAHEMIHGDRSMRGVAIEKMDDNPSAAADLGTAHWVTAFTLILKN